MALQQVHLRINDAATGQPTPVRLRVTDAAGNYYPPHGHPAAFATGVGEDVGGNLLLDGKRWAYIDGHCEISLPSGELTVEATKGPEYRPLRETVHLPAGKLALRFAIERWINLRESGWYAGDIRAHFVSPHAALLEAAAEDVAVVNLLARESPFLANDGQSYLAHANLLAFSGQRPSLESYGHLVAVNTLNTHPILGKLGLLNCHRVVYPLSFGGPDHTDDWSLADWCGQCHRKGGLVVWADAFNPRPGHFGEALACLVLGYIDAVELHPQDAGRMGMWTKFLRAGVRAGIVCGSAKDSNRSPLGAVRTYARLRSGEEFSYPTWIDAVRTARTSISTGPLLSLEVDGESETTLHLRPIGATRVQVRISAQSFEPVRGIELQVNGEIFAESEGSELIADVGMPNGGWLAARIPWRNQAAAFTSPHFVQVADMLPPIDPAAVSLLDCHLQRTRDWIVSEGRFANAASRERLLGTVDAARQRLSDRIKNASPKRR
jgi:hypothetical protein